MNNSKIPEVLKLEYESILERISDEEKPVFQKFCSYYEAVEDLSTLFIRYRHLLDDQYKSKLITTIHPKLNRPIRIGYLNNPDKVFYNELDDVLCNYLRYEGAQVVQFTIEDIHIEASRNGLEIYINNEIAEFDGFLSYGYRSKVNMEAFFFIVKTMEQKGVVCLHSHYHELILNNKMLQATNFASSKVPIPKTYQVFGLTSAKSICNKKLQGKSIFKKLSDYGGDGVFKYEDKWNTVYAAAKKIWEGEHFLLQEMINDSIGQSVRVLCIGGEAYAIMKYEDASGDFRSNVSMGDNFRCVSLMEDPKFNAYKELAEKAIKSVGDVLIGGVDILDSPSEGLVVLEINSWPDLYDIWFNTKKLVFKKLSEAFLKKVINLI